jgi:signal peptidase II
MKIILIIVLIISDLLTKKIIFNNIDLNTFIPLTNFLDITHIHNYGIAFGLFASILQPRIIIFGGILIIIFLLYWMITTKSNLERWGLLFIISGAISNIGDRFMNNYVLDFIYFHYNQYYWPAFNLADIYISVGIFIVIVQTYNLFRNRLKKND